MDDTSQPNQRRRLLGGMLVRRERWSLSWWGRLLALTVLVVLALFIGSKAHQFLALSSPVPAEVLIIEGWIPDYALDEAVAVFRGEKHRTLLTSGGITRDGWRDVPKYTAAQWAETRLRRRGITNDLFAVPCRVERADRTYHSALAVRGWFETNGAAPKAVNVITLGPHARRTRLLFQKALGDNIKVGIIALEDRDYDSKHWWRSSDGTRQVVGEMLAYLYARLFFFPDAVGSPGG
jgi:uncharacterized SAM-binding protein YcdF (DUF218 family)